jgi:anti-sigma B factor antagonist
MHRDDPLKIEWRPGKAGGTRIIQVTGPVTLPNLPAFQDELRRGELPKASILDLSGVDYMDSAGLGAVINYFTHCQRNSIRLMVTGVTPRVRELFKVTKVDSVLAMVDTVEEAEGRL